MKTKNTIDLNGQTFNVDVEYFQLKNGDIDITDVKLDECSILIVCDKLGITDQLIMDIEEEIYINESQESDWDIFNKEQRREMPL